jgi:hypothetical protein
MFHTLEHFLDCILTIKKNTFSWKLKSNLKIYVLKNKGKKSNENKTYVDENPLKCSTQDEMDLVLIVVLFYLIFWSP